MNATPMINAKDAEDSQKPQNVERVENDLSREIIGAAVEVQRVLGVGLLESAYVSALCFELRNLGIPFQAEVPIEGIYKQQALGVVYRADIIVADKVIIEVKACEAITHGHRAQLLTYLRMSGLKLGLLLNFHDFPVAKAVHRLVNKL